MYIVCMQIAKTSYIMIRREYLTTITCCATNMLYVHLPKVKSLITLDLWSNHKNGTSFFSTLCYTSIFAICVILEVLELCNVQFWVLSWTGTHQGSTSWDTTLLLVVVYSHHTMSLATSYLPRSFFLLKRSRHHPLDPNPHVCLHQQKENNHIVLYFTDYNDIW